MFWVYANANYVYSRPVTSTLVPGGLFPTNLSWFLVIVSFLPKKPFPQ